MLNNEILPKGTAAGTSFGIGAGASLCSGLLGNHCLDTCNVLPDKPVTAKPAETRMGSGKGSVEYWVAVVKPGRVMFEIAGVPAG